MPYKPIDFQISIPRTPEGASQQSQMNNRPATDQTLMMLDTVKQTEQLRIRNSAVEQSGNQGLAPNRSRDSRQTSKRKRQGESQHEPNGQQNEHNEALHPFKGKHIDYSL